MSVHTTAYHQIIKELTASGVDLIAVSKTKPNQDIIDLYEIGQRDFGENYVQELVDKAASLPTDIHWHFIGHLQSNKVKYIAPFVHLIHGVDSEKLLQEINKQALKNNRVIDVLLQVHIATEETKFGFDASSLMEFIQSNRLIPYQNISVKGLMGMASFTEDMNKVKNEFASLSQLFQQVKTILPSNTFQTLSMGMSSDYALAIQQGSTMVRIGSLLFGAREYAK
jgi:pyridoxal phosphate enzyme (YggS family)